MNAQQRQAHDTLIKTLMDRGRLIEAGFEGMRIAVIAPDAPTIQVEEMRMAFMAGAQHLWSSIISALDSDSEPTDADMRRMALISEELDKYADLIKLRAAKTGRAQ